MSTALKFSSLGVLRLVRAQVDSALEPVGFSFDLARNLWRRSLGGEIEHFVTLPSDIADDYGPVVVTANLGVHCRTLANHLAHGDDPRRANNLATFTRNIGQLSAKRTWRDWIVRDADEADRVARRLATKIAATGLPWLARFDTLAAFAEGLRTFGRDDHRQCAVPVLERLLADGAPADAADAAWGTVREPAILTLRVDLNEIAWHCDE